MRTTALFRRPSTPALRDTIPAFGDQTGTGTFTTSAARSVSSRMGRVVTALALAAGAYVAPRSVRAQDYELAPIRYSETRPTDRVARLLERIESGELEIDTSDEKRFLRSTLDALGVSPTSQVLVFSKTSLQNSRIAPETPRAIYFSEDCYVGWVQGGAVELSAVDPVLGPTFWILDPTVGKPRRDEGCLSCHAGSMTRDTPGLIVRSVWPDENGFPQLARGSFLTDQTSPLSERWGGWYVTGSHGSKRHMGNVIAERAEDGEFTLDRESGANLTKLDDVVRMDPYLRPTSDILALLVLEHQVTVTNAFTAGSYAARRALAYDETLRENLPDVARSGASDTTRAVVESHADKILRAMLFTDEARLAGGGISGSSEFRESFLADQRRDGEGRSLKDLQLFTRLFKYRLSYFIYSRAFDALPDILRDEVLKRLHDVLTSPQESSPPEYEHLRDAERRTILEILLATKDDLPADWREADPNAR